MSTAEVTSDAVSADRRATAVITVRMSQALHERLRNATRRLSLALGADYSMNRFVVEAIVTRLCELEREAVPSPTPDP